MKLARCCSDLAEIGNESDFDLPDGKSCEKIGSRGDDDGFLRLQIFMREIFMKMT